jgi:hypothetical protein
VQRLPVIVFLATHCLAQPQSYKTTVTPRPNENFAQPCNYDMAIPAGAHTVRAVWVTFDRGRDIMRFYSDPDVIAFARRHDLALMMPHQCPGKNAPGGKEEMDMDPTHGVGRALFTALEQFANQSNHRELASAKLILLGFSGTGALFAHFVGFAPDRVVASLPTDPGHYDPVGIDSVRLPPAAIDVPELIMAGGADKVCGTERPYNYFRRYRDRGAPWAFLVQNKTPHCCIFNTKPLVLEWLDRIIALRQPSPTAPLRKIDESQGWVGFIRTCKSTVHDGWGSATWDVCDANVQPAGSAPPKDRIAAGWFPSHRFALDWLDFIRQPTHPLTSRP